MHCIVIAASPHTVAVFWESHPKKLKSAVIIKTYIVQDTKMSRIRQNYHEDCEALVNKQINMELYASYVYLSMVSIKLKTIILYWFDAKERSHFDAPLKYIIIPCFQTYYFTRDDVALPGFAKYFQKNSDEEREHAQKFMEYQVINCVLLLHFYDLDIELLLNDGAQRNRFHIWKSSIQPLEKSYICHKFCDNSITFESYLRILSSAHI